MKKTNLFLLTTALFGFFALSCNSLKSVPEDMTVAQIIQQGQNYYGSGDYKAAALCYNTVIERYGDDLATYVEAKYELGHLFLKTKDYKKAYSAFSEILEIYNTVSIGTLPASYKKLAQIGIERIPESKQKYEMSTLF